MGTSYEKDWPGGIPLRNHAVNELARTSLGVQRDVDDRPLTDAKCAVHPTRGVEEHAMVMQRGRLIKRVRSVYD